MATPNTVAPEKLYAAQVALCDAAAKAMAAQKALEAADVAGNIESYEAAYNAYGKTMEELYHVVHVIGGVEEPSATDDAQLQNAAGVLTSDQVWAMVPKDEQILKVTGEVPLTSGMRYEFGLKEGIFNTYLATAKALEAEKQKAGDISGKPGVINDQANELNGYTGKTNNHYMDYNAVELLGSIEANNAAMDSHYAKRKLRDLRQGWDLQTRYEEDVTLSRSAYILTRLFGNTFDTRKGRIEILTGKEDAEVGISTGQFSLFSDKGRQLGAGLSIAALCIEQYNNEKNPLTRNQMLGEDEALGPNGDPSKKGKPIPITAHAGFPGIVHSYLANMEAVAQALGTTVAITWGEDAMNSSVRRVYMQNQTRFVTNAKYKLDQQLRVEGKKNHRIQQEVRETFLNAKATEQLKTEGLSERDPRYQARFDQAKQKIAKKLDAKHPTLTVPFTEAREAKNETRALQKEFEALSVQIVEQHINDPVKRKHMVGEMYWGPHEWWKTNEKKAGLEGEVGGPEKESDQYGMELEANGINPDSEAGTALRLTQEDPDLGGPTCLQLEAGTTTSALTLITPEELGQMATEHDRVLKELYGDTPQVEEAIQKAQRNTQSGDAGQNLLDHSTLRNENAVPTQLGMITNAHYISATQDAAKQLQQTPVGKDKPKFEDAVREAKQKGKMPTTVSAESKMVEHDRKAAQKATAKATPGPSALTVDAAGDEKKTTKAPTNTRQPGK